MKIRKSLCVLLAATSVLAVGCNSKKPDTGNVVIYDENETVVTEATQAFTEIKSSVGQSASYGGMTLTVTKAEDPSIDMENGNIALFFTVTIENKSGETVPANYLNNFSATVDGTYYSSDKCITIPVMRKLYDASGFSAMNEEIPDGETRTGYLACEVSKDFKTMELHYLPKTTDHGSMISVPVTADDLTKAN